MHMATLTAKIFRSGNSKALRLPAALDVKARNYNVTPTATGFLVTDPAAEARRRRALEKLYSNPPDIPELERP
ncbi:hypothetical protein OpiT1DRAFT_01171 [Opitutaceae bacterium TAV1]|nr:hypothetical protein OpiT1DRAFT_01166 [Opitutaceae bacterium TAV1]EIP96748.1 hypothetical protein OpiT1DRAFT_01171 [Opitutaceae bacterium TAV1]